MNKNEFMGYVEDNFNISGEAGRLIYNILDYVESHFAGEDEQYLALCELLEDTIGLTDREIRNITL